LGTLADEVNRGEAATPNAEEENLVVLLMYEGLEFEQAANTKTAPAVTRFLNRLFAVSFIKLYSVTKIARAKKTGPELSH